MENGKEELRPDFKCREVEQNLNAEKERRVVFSFKISFETIGKVFKKIFGKGA